MLVSNLKLNIRLHYLELGRAYIVHSVEIRSDGTVTMKDYRHDGKRNRLADSSVRRIAPENARSFLNGFADRIHEARHSEEFIVVDDTCSEIRLNYACDRGSSNSHCEVISGHVSLDGGELLESAVLGFV